MSDKKRLDYTIRDKSPCAGCTERFLACQDRCPKDLRGEKGIKAWKAEIDRVKQARKDYIMYRTPKGYKLYWGGKDGTENR